MQVSSAELDYEPSPIPDLAVTDLSGASRQLGELVANGGAMLLLADPDEAAGRDAFAHVPALLADLPHLRVHCILSSRKELPALPPEARRLALLDRNTAWLPSGRPGPAQVRCCWESTGCSPAAPCTAWANCRPSLPTSGKP